MMNGFFAKVGRLVLVLCAFMSAAASAGTITYYHNDLLGSPVAATDASGAVLWRESYRPYGERLTNSPASQPNDIWFTSRRQDVDTGLVYMGARYYDPAVGRFMSTDPIGFVEGNVHSFNRYAYANNNPYRYHDPNGKWAEEVVGAISLAMSIDAFAKDRSISNGGILLADIVLTAIPGIPAFAGAVVHGGGSLASATAKGVGEASNIANAARLQAQLTGKEIAGGHAFEKHVLRQGEFKGLDIRTREQFAKHIENVVSDPTAVRQLSGGRTAYWHEGSSTVVVRNPRAPDGGSAYQPRDGRAYFESMN